MSCNVEYKYLREKKALALKKMYEMPFYLKEDVKADIYNLATILPLKKIEGDDLLFGRGGVVTDEGQYIDNSAIERRVQYSYEYSMAEYIDKKVVYGGYFVNHWGHFLVEAVSRLWYCLENDETIDNYVFFVGYDEYREVEGNYKEFFELLGIYDKILLINRPTQFKQVVVPELGYKWLSYYSKRLQQMFDKVSDSAKSLHKKSYPSKIFLTRSALPGIKKTEFGSEILDSFFENNGYKIISPERETLTDTISYIREADIVATVSGSLPHNLLFANKGKKVLILERNVLNNEIQVNVNQIKELDVTYIDANLALYPIDVGVGPFILSYKGMLEKYAKDNNMKEPNKKFEKACYLRKSINKYFKAYRKMYSYRWFMYEWMIKYTNYIYEAYEDSLKYLGVYVYGDRPFMIKHYFSVRYVIKNIKKIIIRK